MQQKIKFPKFHEDSKRSDRKRNRSQYLKLARKFKTQEHEYISKEENNRVSQ